jgi:hypothetical protein
MIVSVDAEPRTRSSPDIQGPSTIRPAGVNSGLWPAISPFCYWEVRYSRRRVRIEISMDRGYGVTTEALAPKGMSFNEQTEDVGEIA